MKKGDIVICPDITDRLSLIYLTPNKKYKVVRINTDGGNKTFTIIDNDGEDIGCVEVGCAHLGGMNWIIK